MKKAPPVIRRGVQHSVTGSDPWVDQIDAAELKVRNVASYQRKPVYKRGGGDQGVAFIAAVGNMQSCAPGGDAGIDRQDSSRERRFDVMFQPVAQQLAL